MDPDVGSRQIARRPEPWSPATSRRRRRSSRRSRPEEGPAAAHRLGRRRATSSLNTKVPPFDDMNVRKAVIAGSTASPAPDARRRGRRRRSRTHFLPPGLPGFEEAGGQKGTGRRLPRQHPTATRRSRRSTSRPRAVQRQVRGQREDPRGRRRLRRRRPRRPRSRQTQLQDMGFNVEPPPGPASTHVHAVLQRAQGEGRASARTSAGSRTSPTPQTLLDPTFNGANILQREQLELAAADDPTINKRDRPGEGDRGPRRAAKRGPQVDQMITSAGRRVPWVWDKQPNIVLEERRGGRQLVQRGLRPQLHVDQVGERAR